VHYYNSDRINLGRSRDTKLFVALFSKKQSCSGKIVEKAGGAMKGIEGLTLGRYELRRGSLRGYGGSYIWPMTGRYAAR